MAELQKLGKIRIVESDFFEWSHLVGVNMIFMQRPYRRSECELMNFAKELNIKVWVDYDDDLLSVPQDNPAYGTYNNPETKAAVRYLIKNADAVSVSTEALKYLREDAIVIPNSLNLNLFKFNKPNTNSPIIVWRGGDTHQRDLSLFLDELVQVNEESLEINKDAKMFFLGYKPWFITERLKPKSWVSAASNDVVTYHSILQHIKPKVMFVPLADNKFNDAKSNIAWLEATMAGALTVAPDKPEWRRPGVFNYSNNESFKYQLLKAFKTSEGNHKAMIDLSQKDILENYNLVINNKKRMEIIERLSK